MKTTSESVTKTKGKGSARSVPGSRQPDSAPADDECLREQMIAEAAYFRAEQRGFAPGRELSDWLEAESAVAAALGHLR